MKLFLSLMLGVMLCFTSLPVQACVGKTLVVGALDTPQQQVLSNML